MVKLAYSKWHMASIVKSHAYEHKHQVAINKNGPRDKPVGHYKLKVVDYHW